MQKLTVLFVLLLITSAGNVPGQKTALSKRDKTEIVGTILKKYDFFDDVEQPQSEQIIFLLAENLSSLNLPKINNIKFIFISKTDVEEMKKERTGVEYFYFSPFETRRRSVRISFSSTTQAPSYGRGGTTEYTFRRMKGRWKIAFATANAWGSDS